MCFVMDTCLRWNFSRVKTLTLHTRTRIHRHISRLLPLTWPLLSKWKNYQKKVKTALATIQRQTGKSHQRIPIRNLKPFAIYECRWLHSTNIPEFIHLFNLWHLFDSNKNIPKEISLGNHQVFWTNLENLENLERPSNGSVHQLRCFQMETMALNLKIWRRLESSSFHISTCYLVA